MELRRQCVRYWEDGTEKTVCEILGRLELRRQCVRYWEDWN